MKKEIKIVIIDDHPLIRQGIRKLIENEDGITVIGDCSNVKEGMKLISETLPDIAIVDINLEDEINGIELVKALKKRYPQVLSVVLSIHKESTYAERAIRAGARGYISKNEAPRKIIDAIKSVMEGELFLSKKMSDKIIGKMIHGNNSDGDEIVDSLSNRELEVFELIGKGHELKKIALKLNISRNTMESHRRNIKEKLDIENNSDLIKTAVQWVLSSGE